MQVGKSGALCPKDAGKCLQVVLKVSVHLGSTFLGRNKELPQFPLQGLGTPGRAVISRSSYLGGQNLLRPFGL